MDTYSIITTDLTVEGGDLWMAPSSGNVWGLRWSPTYPNYGIFYVNDATDYFTISPSGGGTTTPDLKISGSGLLTVKSGLTVSAGTVTLPANQIDSAEVSFNYAAGTGKAGNATGVVCANCIELGSETTGGYAAGDAEGGSATGVACSSCVELTTETSGSYAAGDAENGSATNALDLGCSSCVALTTETSGSYAAGDGEAGNALNSDSCSSDGTCEVGILSTTGAATIGGDVYAGGGNVRVNSGNDFGKYCMWNSSDTTYCIGMYSGQTFGGLNDYAMTFQMDADSDMGWLWKAKDGNDAAALTTGGHLTIDDDLVINGGDLSILNINNNGIGFSDTSAYWVKTDTDWGIYWDTTANALEFKGNGADKMTIGLSTGDVNMYADVIVTDLLFIDDDLLVGAGSAVDDYIKFDYSSESLMWDDSPGRFVLSDSLTVERELQLKRYTSTVPFACSISYEGMLYFDDVSGLCGCHEVSGSYYWCSYMGFQVCGTSTDC